VRLRAGSGVLGVVVRHPMGRAGLAILAFFAAMALLAPVLAPYNPWEIVAMPFQPPSHEHPLGTNDMGQDLLSELLYGARVSLSIGVIAAFTATVVGVAAGLLAGYYGGTLDRIVTGIVDVFLLMPALPLMLVLSAFIGPGYFTIIFVIVLISWPPVARMMRAQALSLRERPYVEAARALGAGNARILLHHILPNVGPLALALAVLMIGEAMILEASLSFLGLGDPTKKSWGMMLYWAFQTGAFSYGAWWWIVPPGVCIALSVFGFALLGYAIEEYANPRLRTSGGEQYG
jgi:ABC-type dipeptide/oligopeptide/nickel transport system permease subunit